MIKIDKFDVSSTFSPLLIGIAVVTNGSVFYANTTQSFQSPFNRDSSCNPEERAKRSERMTFQSPFNRDSSCNLWSGLWSVTVNITFLSVPF